MRVRSKDEALTWCDRFAAVIGHASGVTSAGAWGAVEPVERFLGPVAEPWDLGVMPKPENAPLRFLSIHQADERAESEAPRPRLMARMGTLVGGRRGQSERRRRC